MDSSQTNEKAIVKGGENKLKELLFVILLGSREGEEMNVNPFVALLLPWCDPTTLFCEMLVPPYPLF